MLRASKNTIVVTGLVAAVTFASTAVADEIPIGSQAPPFELKGTDGAMHSLATITASQDDAPAPQATVVVFTCNHCPFAQAYEPVLIDLATKYAERGVAWVLINPNDAKIQPQDSFDKMVERATEKGYPFPYLFDATQETAKAYGARVTPHVFLLDAERIVRYHGRVNDAKEQDKVQSNDLVDAIEAVLAGNKVANASTKAFGCTIKWKKDS